MAKPKLCRSWPNCRCAAPGYINRHEPDDCGRKPPPNHTRTELPIKELRRRLSTLSPRAKALYNRLLDGRFYKAFERTPPKAMQELLDLDLVSVAGRVAVMTSCYVVLDHFETFEVEKWKKRARA